MGTIHAGRRSRYPLVDVELGLSTRPRPNPFVVLWRWRYEVTVVILAVAGTWAALRTGTGQVAAAALAVAAVTTWAWRPARRFAIARIWCVVTPHRVRTACAEAWVQNRSGGLPMVLWTSSEPYGERVVLWCRAGMTVEDLKAQEAMLATACWAEDVQVVQSLRHPYIVALEVARQGLAESGAGRPTGPDDIDLDSELERQRLAVRLLPPAS